MVMATKESTGIDSNHNTHTHIKVFYNKIYSGQICLIIHATLRQTLLCWVEGYMLGYMYEQLYLLLYKLKNGIKKNLYIANLTLKNWYYQNQSIV